MQRIAVIVRLKPGAAERAEHLIAEGPPFDPTQLGVQRHTVFLTDEEAVFVFEGGDIRPALSKASRLLSPGVLAAWEPVIEGLPRVAREAFFWKRREQTWDAGWSE
jgi:hypothetical protein